MATCVVSGRFVDSENNGISGASIIFSVDNPVPDDSGYVITPKEVSTTTNASGDWSLTLTREISGVLTIIYTYSATAPSARQTFSLVIPDAATATFSSCWADSPNFSGVDPAFPIYFSDIAGQLAESQLPDSGSFDDLDISGTLGVGTTAVTTYGVKVSNTALTGTDQIGVYSNITGSSASTSSLAGFQTNMSTAASAYTTSNAFSYYAANISLGAGSAITNQYGLYVGDLTSGTNNFAFRSSVSSGTGKYNLYISGTADNYLAGKLGIGMAPTKTLDVTGTFRVSGIATFSSAPEISQISNTGTLTLPTATTTLVGRDTTDTLTNKTISTAGTNLIGSTAISGTTGSGNVVFSASPVLTGTVSVGSNLEVGGTGATTQVYIPGTSTDFPSSTYDATAVILKTGSGGSAPFDNAGSLILRSSVSSTTGRGSILFYTGSPTTQALKLDETQGATIAGVMGVNGATATSTQGLAVNSPTTVNTSNIYGLKVDSSPTASTNGTYNWYGIYYGTGAQPKVPTGVSNSGMYIGVRSNVLRQASSGDDGTLSQGYAFYGQYGNNGTGSATTTLAYGLYLKGYYSNGTVGTMYGIFLDTPTTGGTLTNQAYGIYQADTSARNYFGGVMGVNGATPATTQGLAVKSPITADTANIYGLKVDSSPTATVDGAYPWYGIFYGNNSAPKVPSGVTNSSFYIGVRSTALRQASSGDDGTLAGSYAFYGQYGNAGTGTGTTTNTYGMYLKGYYSNGTVGNLYGLYIDSPTTGGTLSGTSYGIYQAHTSSSNYFGGSTTFNGTTTFSDLATFVKGTTKGITIGDVSTNSGSVLRMQGTSAGYNWQLDNNVTVTGLAFVPSTATGGTTYSTQVFSLFGNGDVAMGSAALATNATAGFFYIASCAGAPTGVPTTRTGRVAIHYDTTNNKFYVYNGGWKSVTLA